MMERRGRNRAVGRWTAGVVVVTLIVIAVVVAAGFAGIPPIGTDREPATGGADGNETNEMDTTTTDNTATTTDNTATTTDNAATTTRDTTSIESAATETVVLDYTIEQVPEPGLVRVTVTVESSATLTGLEIHLPEDSEYVRSRGLARYLFDWANEWTVNGSAATPSITYIAPVNDTDAGDIESVDVGEWALFDVNIVDVELDWSGVDNAAEMTAARNVHVTSRGIAGPGFAYLGPYREYSRAVANGSIHLIVPNAATMVADRDTVLSQLAFAATELRVGERDEQVNVYVAPAPIETSYMYAIEYNGTQGVLVHQNSTTSDYDNTWLHEYVHTRQSYTLGKKMRWFDEASAEYYAALLTYHSVLRTGYEDWVLFQEFYRYVTPRLFSDTVLANVGPRPTAAMYFKGMRVLAALDARIRVASNGKHTLEDVFRRMNTHEGVVTYEDFQAFVADAAGQSLDGWLNRYIRTNATPPVPQNPSLFIDVQRTTRNASRPPEKTVGGSGETSHRRGGGNHTASVLTESTAFEQRKNDSQTGLSSRSLLAHRHVDVAICNLDDHH